MLRKVRRISTRRSIFFFFNDTATTEIYTLSLHDALPILRKPEQVRQSVMTKLKTHGKGIVLLHDFQHATAEAAMDLLNDLKAGGYKVVFMKRSEEHTSELQSQSNLVCRLLLEKKNIRVACLDHSVLPLDVAECAQALAEGLTLGGISFCRERRSISYPSDFR